MSLTTTKVYPPRRNANQFLIQKVWQNISVFPSIRPINGSVPRIGQSDMDVRTEQTYQQRIVKLELQNTSLETCVSDLTRQLAERNEQLAQRDATIAALQQQVAELSKQVADLLAQVARLSKNSSNSSKPPSVRVDGATGVSESLGKGP